MVGVERETDRLAAAKKREHFAMQVDEEDGESCDPHPKSCDPQVTSCDLSEWSSYLHRTLPVDLMSPFHVSLELNLDNTQQSKDKFYHLLHHLQGDSHTHTCAYTYAHKPFFLEVIVFKIHTSISMHVYTHSHCTYACTQTYIIIVQIFAFLEAIVFQFPGLSFVKGALRICIVGLHCCGDLTPSILTLFTENTLPPLPSLTALVLIGCCYHKTGFPQWRPVSKAARELMKGREDVVNTYALRLAAQETRER